MNAISPVKAVNPPVTQQSQQARQGARDRRQHKGQRSGAPSAAANQSLAARGEGSTINVTA